MRVFDLLGREVATLANGPASAGEHSVTFDAADHASGIYFLRLEADGQTVERKIVLTR